MKLPQNTDSKSKIFTGKRELPPAKTHAIQILEPPLKQSVIKPISSVTKPSEITTVLWIEERNEYKDALFDSLGGKWLLFYNKTELDKKWSLAKKLYNDNKFDNVIYMKVSTAMPNPKSTNPLEGVIAFYVGKTLISDDKISDEEIILKQGKQLQKLFSYESRLGKIYYKTEYQSEQQVQNPEIKRKNYTFTIECPKISENNN